MIASLPFLRSPPFPDTVPWRASVSEAWSGAPNDVGGDATLDALRTLRVGGNFWGVSTPSRPMLVRANVQGDVPRMLGGNASHLSVLPRRHGASRRLSRTAFQKGWDLIAPASDPWALVKTAQAVWCEDDDEIAHVAWLSGISVFSHDGEKVPDAKLAEGAARALAEARYRNPFNGEPWTVMECIAQLADWRRVLDANRDIVAVAGISRWKRRQIARFLWDGRCSPSFHDFGGALRLARIGGGAIAAWPSRVPGDATASAAAAGRPLITIEDGFIRSRGLGCDLTLPWSLVVDPGGIYFRPDAPCSLETVLASHAFPPALEARGAALRQSLCAARINKYCDVDSQPLSDLPRDRRVVLAIGQVEDDLSVRFGGAGVRGNLDFLSRVRAAEPDAYIIYRPHPDVVAGHRRGALDDTSVLAHVDRVESGGSVLTALEAVDAVHVLSSLTGFEALLRDCEVIVHGRPFYAGWGLTRDLAVQGIARGRQLTIDQLVAGALIIYPRYLDPVTRLPCSPEVLIDRLATNAMPPPGLLIRLRRIQGRLRRRWARV